MRICNFSYQKIHKNDTKFIESANQRKQMKKLKNLKEK